MTPLQTAVESFAKQFGLDYRQYGCKLHGLGIASNINSLEGASKDGVSVVDRGRP